MPTICSKLSKLRQDPKEFYISQNEQVLPKIFELPPLQWKNGASIRGRCAIALSKADGNQFPFPPIHKLDQYTESCWPICEPCGAKKMSSQFDVHYFSDPLKFSKLMEMKMKMEPFQENSIGYRRKLSRDRLNAETSCVCAEFQRVGRDTGNASKMENLISCSNHTISVNCSVIHQLPLKTSSTSATIHPHHDINPIKEANQMLKPSKRFYGHPTINQSKFPFPPSHLYDKYTGTCWTTCFVCHPNTSIPKFRLGYFHKEAQFSKSMEPMQLMEGSYPDKSIHARRMTSPKNDKIDIYVD